MKKCAFPHARHICSLESYFTRGRCRLAWRVLTLADENYLGEPHEILVKCFKNFVYPWFARRKKKANSEWYFKIFYSLVSSWTALWQREEKQNWNNQRISQMNSNFFNKEFVNLSGGQFFATAEDRHLWNVSETLKEFTLPVIFSFFSQQRNRHCSVTDTHTQDENNEDTCISVFFHIYCPCSRKQLTRSWDFIKGNLQEAY